MDLFNRGCICGALPALKFTIKEVVDDLELREEKAKLYKAVLSEDFGHDITFADLVIEIDELDRVLHHGRDDRATRRQAMYVLDCLEAVSGAYFQTARSMVRTVGDRMELTRINAAFRTSLEVIRTNTYALDGWE